MTDDQGDRLIAALERIAAVNEERLRLQRETHQRMEERMGAGPRMPPDVREDMERRRREGPPPEVKRIMEALERIAAGLERGERLPGT